MRSYYVYHLIDPRDGVIFYVGKGSGRRMTAHERDVKAGRPSHNKLKDARIRDILDAGLMVSAVRIADYAIEQDAVDHEEELIATLSGLTNIRAKGWARTPEAGAMRAIERRLRLQRCSDEEWARKNLDSVKRRMAPLLALEAAGKKFGWRCISTEMSHVIWDNLKLAVGELETRFQRAA